jgi:hypothetical protein
VGFLFVTNFILLFAQENFHVYITLFFQFHNSIFRCLFSLPHSQEKNMEFAVFRH